MLPDALTAPEFELERQVLRAVSVGQGDTEYSTALHVHSAAVVVGGDVVYNDVHMMTAETDDAGSTAWIASLHAIAALAPEIAVAGASTLVRQIYLRMPQVPGAPRSTPRSPQSGR